MYHLIFKDEEDQTSNLTIDWLCKIPSKILVINNDNLWVSDFIITNNGVDFILTNNKITFTLREIQSYWLRRGHFYLTHKIDQSNSAKNTYLQETAKFLFSSISSLIYRKHGLGKIELNDTDKLLNLALASECGLVIPSTFVSSFKNVLDKRLSEKQYCTKAIRQGYYTDGVLGFVGNTVLAQRVDLEKLENTTWPSLLQEYQEKRYELRIFYLEGDFYNSAIFSQNDEQTKIDFRHYNYARPNRTPPYKLPKEIEKKLHSLMQKLTIKCGSIDMVVNTKNEFVFLEVNPFGQFQQVSFPCNYYLELKVAEYLTKYDRKEKDVC